MPIYTKHGKKVLPDTIRIDGDCYFANKVIKIRAVVEGEAASRLLYVTDLLADDGRTEINEIIKAAQRKR